MTATFTEWEIRRFARLAGCQNPTTDQGARFLARTVEIAVNGDFTTSDRSQDVADQVVEEFRDVIFGIYTDLRPRPDLGHLRGQALLANEVAWHSMFAAAAALASHFERS